MTARTPRQAARKNIIAGRGLLVVTLALSLASCSSLSGYPKPSSDPKAELQTLQVYFSPAEIAKYDALTDPAAKRLYRNEIVTGRLRAIDLNYNAFVKALFVEHGTASLGGDLAILGLNAAGSVVGGAVTKSALAAASGGIAGAKGAVDTDLFYAKTLPALVAQMDAQRKTVLVNIRRGLAEPMSDYPLQQGLADLDSYYNAGTLPGAVTGIIEDAGAKSAAAEFEIRRTPEFVANRAKAETIVDRIAKLSPDQAIALAKIMDHHLSERSNDLQQLLQRSDPKKRRLTDGAAAKRFLSMWASMDNRSAASLKEWTDGLDRVEKR